MLRNAVTSLWILAFLAACAPSKQERAATRAVDDYLYGNYASAIQKLKPLAANPDENFVLNNARLGSSALADYDFDEAEAAFLRAYEVINSTGVNKGGRDVAAVLINEKHKVWKGEPFERAMVNFYLGLIYYARHDYENARAAFENSLFKLRDYGEDKEVKDDKYREIESDFALGMIMLAKAHQRLGNEAQARKNFERVLELRPKLRSIANPQRNEESNVLLVIDFGYGPKRVNDQLEGAIVGFAPRPDEVGPIPLPRIHIDGERTAGPRTPLVDLPPVDLLALAQDKRWQSIDTIRTVKSVLGTGLIAAGAYQTTRIDHRDRNKDVAAAAALIGAGLLLKATSQADVRTWEMLPRTVFLVPLKLPPGKHDLDIQFPEATGLSQSWRGIEAPEEGEATYYFRIQPNVTGPYDWPPPAIARTLPPPRGASLEAAPENEVIGVVK